MTTVVIAEKPSVARDIARVLGVRGKGKGCLIGEGWRVTWALGHLMHFAEPLRSAELTAAWERRLKDIEHGSAGADAFYRDICNLITDLIPRVRTGSAMTPEQVAAARTASGQPADRKGRRARGRRQDRRQDQTASKTQPAGHTALGTCPVCKRGDVVETPKAYGCSRWREGCDFVVPMAIDGYRLSQSELRILIEQGQIELPDSDGARRLCLDARHRLELVRPG